ncbi:hypothetical protein N7532_011165 [Penicillium argentinense]|uniref:Uncharacterized protein n=1 Tax=Penicillium argentinense TaxID=1131581 RepID=A0A9W9EHW2_9EURO|nr:uncharacterized protein N7532_011165 [Penicillium argentinense]KAJ5082122.1 hypothetical protein N7532_011165 [Penicillium argentinense]
MRLFLRGLGYSQSRFILLFLLVLAITARVSAQRAGDTTTDTTADAAQTTDDPSTTDKAPSVTETTAEKTTDTTTTTTSSTSSDKTTSTTSSKTTKTTSMDTTSTTSSTSSETTSSTTDSTTTTSSSVSTTTTSTSSSSTSTAAAIVTVPPTANAPYMQTSNTPEGTVFIAVGAALGLIGLAVLAWRGMVAWSVNRSVRRAAMAQSESKRLLRNSRKKRSGTYAAAPATDVSLEKLGAATRASYKPSKRVPSTSSGLFYSPTAGGAGSHHSLNATNNRGSAYLPAGFYAAAGGSSTPRDSFGGNAPGYPPTGSSPSLPPTGTYHDAPHHSRHSYVGGSTSSLNLNQAPQGRAPSAYLEDLFENHAPPPRRPDRR